MSYAVRLAVGLSAVALSACGPGVNPRYDHGQVDGGGAGDNDGGDSDYQCVPTESTESSCWDGVDNDCDNNFDCYDPDCAEACAAAGADAGDCGEAIHSGDTLAIPDGVGESYETSLNISGFGDGAKLDDYNKFIGVCVNMEHTWLRDLQIELVCPSGQVVVLQEFLGQTGSEIYMGEPNDSDSYDPIPGVGYDYCWTPAATNAPMLDWCNANMPSGTLPAGDYQAAGGWDPLVGCDLNGAWTIRATDLWGIDNGFIFYWTIEFDSSLIPDCDDWIVE